MTHRSTIRFLEANFSNPEATISEANVQYLAKLTGAEYVVFGELTGSNDSCVLSLKIIDAATSRSREQLTVHAAPGCGGKLIDSALRSLANSLVHIDKRFAYSGNQDGHYPLVESYTAFEKGLRLAARGQFQDGVESLRQAAETDPSFAAARTEALYLHVLRYNIAGIKSDLRALDSAEVNLLPRERLEKEIARAESLDDVASALRAARQYSSYVPEDRYLEGLFALRSNLLKDALRAFTSNPKDSPFLSRSIDYWSQYVRTLHLLKRYDEEFVEARKAHELFPDSLGTAWYQVRALIGSGRFDDAVELHQRIQPFPDHSPEANISHWENTARELRAHGARIQAAEITSRMITVLENRTPEGLRSSFRQLAALYELSGRWSDARPIVLAMLGESPIDAVWERKNLLTELGCIDARLGNADAARGSLKGLEELRKTVPDEQKMVMNAAIDISLGVVLGCLGEKAAAVGLIKRGRNTPGAPGYGFGYGFGPWLHRDIYLEPLRGYPQFERLIRPR